MFFILCGWVTIHQGNSISEITAERKKKKKKFHSQDFFKVCILLISDIIFFFFFIFFFKPDISGLECEFVLSLSPHPFISLFSSLLSLSFVISI